MAPEQELAQPEGNAQVIEALAERAAGSDSGGLERAAEPGFGGPGDPLPPTLAAAAAAPGAREIGGYAQMLGGGDDDVPVDDGSETLQAHGAYAAATPAGVLLGGADAPTEVLAEEAVHFVQHQIGTGGARTSQPGDRAELEAAWIANQIAHGETPDEPGQPATGLVMRNTTEDIQRHLDQIRVIARTTSSELFSEFDAVMYTSDTEVRSIIARYFREVRAIDATAYVVDQARRLLQEAYEPVGGEPLQTAIRDHVESDVQAETLGWITVRGVAVPANPSTPDRAEPVAADTASDTASDAPAASAATSDRAPTFADGLSDALKEAIRVRARGSAVGLRNKLRDAIFVIDADVLADLRAYRAAVDQDLQAERTQVSDREAAVRWAVSALRHAYGQLTLHSLVTDIESGLELDSETQALGLVHARGSGAATVRTSGAPGEAVDAGELSAEERVASGGAEQVLRWLHNQIEALSSGGSVDLVDARYDQALAHFTGAGASASRAQTLLRDAYQEAWHVDLIHHLREAAGDDRALAADLGRRLGLPVASLPDAPADRTEEESAESARAELRNRMHELHRPIEALRADPSEGNLAPVDEAYDTLSYTARRRGVSDAAARTLLAEIYREVIGRDLLRHLVLACGGDQALATGLGRRLGLTLQVEVDASTEAGRTEAEGRLREQLAQKIVSLHTEIDELRLASVTAGFQVDDIETVWDEITALCHGADVRGGALLSLVSGLYRDRWGVALSTALSLACEANEDYATRLREITGLNVRTIDRAELAETAAPGDTSARDAILQELQNALSEDIVEDDSVLRLCQQLDAAVRTQVETADAGRSERVATHASALAEAVEAYETRFGDGLASQIRAGVDDATTLRRCLTLIGAREDTTERLVTAALGDVAEGEDAETLEAQLEALSEELRGVAETIAGAASYALAYSATHQIRDAVLLYPAVHTRYAERPALASRLATRATSRRLLVQHYAAVEGDLVHDIATYCRPDHADEAFAALGLGDRRMADAAHAAGTDGDVDLTEDESDREERIRLTFAGLTPPIFREIEQMRTAMIRSVDVADIDTLWDGVVAAGVGLGLDLAETRRHFQATYREAHHIGFVQHLSIGTGGDADIAVDLTNRLGIPVEASTREAAGAQSTFDVHVDTGESGLSERDAFRLAQRLYAAIDEGNEAQVQSIMAHDRPAAEREVIRRAFEASYDLSLDYMIQAAFYDDEGALTRATASVADDSRLTLRQELLTFADSGDRDEVFRRCMRATPAQRAELLDDVDLMGRFQEAFAEDDYVRIRNTLSGHVDVSDLVDTRDTGASWYNLGFGTETEELTGDLTDFVRMRRAAVTTEVRADEATYSRAAMAELFPAGPPTTAEGRGRLRSRTAELMTAEINRRMRAVLREVTSDPDTIANLERELGGEELLAAELTLADTDGELSPYDEVLANPTRDDLIAKLGECSDAELARLRANDDFMARLRGNSTDVTSRALRILEGDEELGAIEAALEAMDTDENAIFTNLGEMDADAMYAATQDAALMARIRENLDGAAADDVSTERGLFEAMVTDMADLGPASPDATVEERRARLLRELVIRHTYALRSGIQSGREDTLRAAQACFNERGTFLPDPADEDRTERIFVRAQREEILDAVGPALAAAYSGDWNEAFTLDADVRYDEGEGEAATERTENEFVHAVRQGILGDYDPALYRLSRGVRGIDTGEENITDAIQNAGAQTIARRWSNILEVGHDDGIPFVQVVGRWIAAGRPDEGAERAAVTDYRLDVSASCRRYLQDEGMAGDRELLDRMNAVRARILGLSPSDVMDALGTRLTMIDTDTEVVMGDDRVARSRLTHDLDTFHHHTDGRSAVDLFGDEREDVLTNALQYTGDMNAALEDGSLTREEIEALATRREDFQAAVQDYREAQEAAADVAKGIAIAVIGAVATALTGPGGPTLMIAMATAGAQAAVSAVIDEAFRGRDYEFVQEGMVNVVQEVALAGISHGLGEWFEGALAGSGALGRLGDLAERVTALRASLEAAAETSHMAMFRHAMLEGLIDATTGIGSDAASDILAILQSDVWVDGFNQGLTRSQTRITGSIATWPEEWVQQFGMSVFNAYTQRGIDAVAPEWEAPDEMGPVRGAVEGSVRDTPRAILEAGRDVAGRELSGAATDLAHGEDVDALDGSHWRGEMVGDELRDLAADRASAALDGSAEGIAEERNEAAGDAWLDSEAGRATVARVTRPTGMTDEQLRLFLRDEYVAHGPDRALSPGAERRLARVNTLVERNLAERTPPMTASERREYFEWVYARPSRMEARALEGDATGHLTNPIPDPTVTVEPL